MAVKGSKYMGLIVGGSLLVFIAATNRLSEKGYNVYPATAPQAVQDKSPLRFTESAASLGIDSPNRYYYPNPHPKAQQYAPLLSLSPSVAVADINGDGFMDFYVTRPAPELSNQLFINQGGQGFKDIAAEVGLDDMDPQYKEPSMSYFADFTGDGKLDVFMARYGCHTLHTQQDDGTFSTSLVGYCSQPWSINVLDFNRDGALDVYFGNYYDTADLSKHIAMEHIFTRAGLPRTGAGNQILLGNGDGTFKLLPYTLMEDYKDHTAAVGISDINLDGYPDIAVSNDYNPNRMYLNVKGQTVKEITEEAIPTDKHGFNDMNAEFVDFDMDGLIDLFVTGGFGPPISMSDNLLWKRKQGDKIAYEEVAKKWGAHGCGSAWTAKFSDFDNDGELDLFIINGQGYGQHVSQKEGAKSYNYVRNEVRSTPGSLRYTLESMPDFSDYEMWSFQRSCVLWRQGERFYDVADSAGLSEYLEDGRSMALTDFDNDGKQDVIVINMNGPLYAFKNTSLKQGNWLGLEAVMPNGMAAHGARIVGTRSDNKPLIREVYPGNGHHSQNDSRQHFGLGDHTLVAHVIMVIWPTGESEIFENIPLNTYTKLIYGTGRKS